MLKTVCDRLDSLGTDTRVLDLSKMNLDNMGVEFAASRLRNYPLIEEVNLSDNNFSMQGVLPMISELSHLKNLTEFNFSNNWLLEKHFPIIVTAVVMKSLQTLRLCNAQLTESSLVRFSFLRAYSLRSIYLDHNNLGNRGFVLLLTYLRFNPSVEFVSLRNNNISDTGVNCLHAFFRFSSRFPKLDIRHNPIIQSSSFALLHSMAPTIVFTPKEPSITSLQPTAPFDKPFRDICVILQLLECMLRQQNIRDCSACIPRKLVFNLALETHRKIIQKLLDQPSLLAQRIDSVCGQLSGSEGLLQLVSENVHLMSRYLLSDVSLTIRVSPLASISPPASLSPSPTLRASSSLPVQTIALNDPTTQSSEQNPSTGPTGPAGMATEGSGGTGSTGGPTEGSGGTGSVGVDGPLFTLPATIQLSVGTVRRVGCVKVRLIRMLGCALKSQYLPFVGSVIASNLHRILMQLFVEHPWNSILHEALTFYFISALSIPSPSLWFDLIANHQLHVFLMDQLQEKKKEHGYSSFLLSIARLVEMKRVEWGNAYLDEVTKDNCSYSWAHFCELHFDG